MLLCYSVEQTRLQRAPSALCMLTSGSVNLDVSTERMTNKKKGSQERREISGCWFLKSQILRNVQYLLFNTERTKEYVCKYLEEHHLSITIHSTTRL